MFIFMNNTTNSRKHANAALASGLAENVVEYALKLDHEIVEQAGRIARLKQATEQYEGAFAHGNDTSGMLQKAHHGVDGDGLAASGFADDAQCFALIQKPGDAANRLHFSAGREKRYP